MNRTLLAFALVGCAHPEQDPDDGNQTGQEAPKACDVGDRTTIGVGDTTPAGFVTQDFFEGFGEVEVDFAWADGATTTAAIRMELDEESGETYWLVPFDDCEPYTSVPIWLEIETADGGFDERLRTEVAVFGVDRAVAWSDTYGEFLGGDVDLERFGTVRNLADTIVYFQAVVTETAWGTVEMRAQDEENGSDLVDVATWAE